MGTTRKSIYFSEPRATEFTSERTVALPKTSFADRSTFKYLAEEYPVTWNFENRLRSGQTIQSGAITVRDVDGLDVTTSFILGASGSVDSPRISTTMLRNAGVIGQFYYVHFNAQCEADAVEAVLEVEIR